MEKSAMDSTDKSLMQPMQPQSTVGSGSEEPGPKPSIPKRLWNNFKTPGSALQIIAAAVLAIAIGLIVTSTTNSMPKAVPTILAIPGQLWLRCLKAIVLPLIVCSMILAIQNLKEMTGEGKVLARWTVGYYVLTTLVSIGHSVLLTALVWRTLMTPASEESLEVAEADKKLIEERKKMDIPAVVVELFNSFVPANVVNALATDSLLAVLITAIIIGYLIDGKTSSIIKAVREIESLVMVIITFLIKLAPLGVFFLILPNMFKLKLESIGQNLGVLIGSAIAGMMLHLFVILPIIYFGFTRQNPYTYWFKNSPAWTTAWGCASSAATMPVTLRCCKARGIPNTVTKFAIPLGTLVNMDGTAIYFPIVVVFLAETNRITLNAADYIIVFLLATLASIGTTPIPSSSLVLTIMIASAVNVPITGMYAVVVAIDWFLDRFRTMVNVSGDLFAAKVVAKMTGITDPDEGSSLDEEHEGPTQIRENSDRV